MKLILNIFSWIWFGIKTIFNYIEPLWTDKFNGNPRTISKGNVAFWVIFIVALHFIFKGLDPSYRPDATIIGLLQFLFVTIIGYTGWKQGASTYERIKTGNSQEEGELDAK